MALSEQKILKKTIVFFSFLSFSFVRFFRLRVRVSPARFGAFRCPFRVDFSSRIVVDEVEKLLAKR